jgi:hypothetical protein
MKFSKGEIIRRDDLAYPEGALVCDGYDDAGRLLAHPLGGGFQLTVPAQDEPRFRVVAEGERGAALFRRTRFVLADSEEAFEGWTNGELWNGWEMPEFEKAMAERLLAWLGDQRGRFDGKLEAFVTMSQDGEEEIWAGEEITITDGSRIKAYPVGAGAWTWEET